MIQQILTIKNLLISIKNVLSKPCSFLAAYARPVSGNRVHFKKDLLERIEKLIMINDDKIRDEKLHYYINREAAKTSALLSGKIDKYEYLTGEEILPSISKTNNRSSRLVL